MESTNRRRRRQKGYPCNALRLLIRLWGIITSIGKMLNPNHSTNKHKSKHTFMYAVEIYKMPLFSRIWPMIGSHNVTVIRGLHSQRQKCLRCTFCWTNVFFSLQIAEDFLKIYFINGFQKKKIKLCLARSFFAWFRFCHSQPYSPFPFTFSHTACTQPVNTKYMWHYVRNEIDIIAEMFTFITATISFLAIFIRFCRWSSPPP